MLIGFGGSSSAAGPWVPSKTQSVEISTTCAPTALAASTTCRVAGTKLSHALRRSTAGRRTRSRSPRARSRRAWRRARCAVPRPDRSGRRPRGSGRSPPPRGARRRRSGSSRRSPTRRSDRSSHRHIGLYRPPAHPAELLVERLEVAASSRPAILVGGHHSARPATSVSSPSGGVAAQEARPALGQQHAAQHRRERLGLDRGAGARGDVRRRRRRPAGRRCRPA